MIRDIRDGVRDLTPKMAAQEVVRRGLVIMDRDKILEEILVPYITEHEHFLIDQQLDQLIDRIEKKYLNINYRMI